MTTLKPIPPIAVVQAVARNGAQYRNLDPQNMRHAFAVRGEDLPEESKDNSESHRRPADLNAIKSLFSEVEQKHNQLKFEFNESLNRILVSVIDRETGELIRQIPGESAVATAEHLIAADAGEIKSGMLLSSEI